MRKASISHVFNDVFTNFTDDNLRKPQNNESILVLMLYQEEQVLWSIPKNLTNLEFDKLYIKNTKCKMWVIVADCGWLWLISGRLWLIMGGCGWLWVIARFSITQIIPPKTQNVFNQDEFIHQHKNNVLFKETNIFQVQ